MRRLFNRLKQKVALAIFYMLKDRITEIADQQIKSTLLFKPLIFGDAKKLRIHSTAVVNNALFNLESGSVDIGEYAFFGHGVSVLTGSHKITKTLLERQTSIPAAGRDIIIEEGVWIASNAMVIGPCHIGKNAVIGPNVVITGVVPADTKITLGKDNNSSQLIDYSRQPVEGSRLFK